ncbi:MAG: efflux RND transporter periplasmic adaptor subunit [Bacteroidia bacterium]
MNSTRFKNPTINSFLLVLISQITLSCSESVEYFNPSKKTLIHSVYASAYIESSDQYEHRTEVSGRLTRYFVKEGFEVNAGDIIAELEQLIPNINISNANEAYKLAVASKSQLSELSIQLRQLEDQMEQDSINLSRQRRLFEKNVGSKSQLENFELKAKSSRRLFEATRKKYELLAEQIKASIMQSKNNYELAQANSNKFFIYAFRSGKVYSLPNAVGSIVNPQQPFAIIGNNEDFTIVMEVDEADISKISVGQEVWVKLEAYEKSFKAELTSIRPLLDARNQTFRAEAKFISEVPTLYPGLNAECNIIIDRKENILVLPNRLIEGDSAVYTEDGIKSIKIGLKNQLESEIVSGLVESDKIKEPEDGK